MLALVVQLRSDSEWTWLALFAVLVAAVGAWLRLADGREGQAFALLGVVIGASVLALFGALYPNVLPSTVDPAYSLSIADTASSPYTLTVMTWVAAFGAPGGAGLPGLDVLGVPQAGDCREPLGALPRLSRAARRALVGCAVLAALGGVALVAQAWALATVVAR